MAVCKGVGAIGVVVSRSTPSWGLPGHHTAAKDNSHNIARGCGGRGRERGEGARTGGGPVRVLEEEFQREAVIETVMGEGI